ncbi:hypothetical protein GGR56DRAFT_675413 [Xylariaceae sp. FL0804]|nr:hypothetical protein GGR56DRAFT_675413 [Xylariaceae sp. FL0804]
MSSVSPPPPPGHPSGPRDNAAVLRKIHAGLTTLRKDMTALQNRPSASAAAEAHVAAADSQAQDGDTQGPRPDPDCDQDLSEVLGMMAELDQILETVGQDCDRLQAENAQLVEANARLELRVAELLERQKQQQQQPRTPTSPVVVAPRLDDNPSPTGLAHRSRPSLLGRPTTTTPRLAQPSSSARPSGLAQPSRPSGLAQPSRPSGLAQPSSRPSGLQQPSTSRPSGLQQPSRRLSGLGGNRGGRGQ